MKKIHLLSLGSMLFLYSALCFAQSRDVEVTSYPTASYEERNDPKDYLPGNKDWVVLFEVPENSRAHLVVAEGDREREVLRSSDIDREWRKDGKRYVKVLTGAGARRGYKGNLGSWARSLKLRYLTPFQPRGSARPPVRPRG